jgi:hypothetical protein
MIGLWKITQRGDYMPVSNVVYLNRIEAARSRKQIRSRPARIPVQGIADDASLKEFLDAVKGCSERQSKLSQY